ncbi:DUF1080 domain-containing protein [Flavobacteriaceae bacterium]|nr:DUF1080 domain-containing protein [Flavobacteriaceae bacterium]MDC1279571.1 DUF1080 domain-containing protein [Flavobacteriaceae bacterium]MDC1336970.1 DUF1080 domain-containing protein [Flavobacteriaceae bacterium]
MKLKLFYIFFLSFSFALSQSKATEIWEPIPEKIESFSFSKAPSDAIILFDGTDFSNWVTWGDKEPQWIINNDGSMTVVNGKGAILTKESFGSVQLHIEWKTGAEGLDKHNNQSRSNSGVFFQKNYEIQILDSYQNPTYVNGQAGSVYKQHIPLKNASKKPGDWQSYDIIFTAPEFKNKILVNPGYFTVFHNGVLIQNHVEIKGTTTNVGQPKYSAHGNAPIMLQDHCCIPLSFRNIWLRKLD